MVGKKVKRAEFIEKYSILDDLKYDIFLLEPTHEMYLNSGIKLRIIDKAT